ncbi:MAG TPA: hypothetical protein VNI01_14330, partial [Elusimicrobiota bacterium]|nr:hypothetical protein [Elusimicrobiota bacterium]
MNARAALAALLALSSWSPSAYAALAFPDLGAARRPLSPEAAPERPPEQPNPRQRLLDDLGELQHDPRVARFLQDHPDAVLSLSQENGREAIEARYPPPDRSRHIFVLPSPERPDLEHNYLHYSPEGYVIGQGNYAVGPDGGIQFKEEKVLLDGHDVHGTTPDAPVPGGEQAVSLVSHQDEEETQESATPRLLHPGFVPPERLNLCAEGGTRCYVFGSGTRANVLYYVGADGERVPVGALRTFNVQNAPGESLEFLTVLGQGGAQAYARNGTWLGAWSELEQQALSINRREAAGSERPMLPVQFHGGYVTQAVDADGVLYQVASWRDDGAGRQVPVYRRHALFSARPHPPAGTFDYAHFGRNEEEARRLGLPGYWGSGGASELSRLYWFDAQGVGRHIGSQWNNQEDGRGVNLINIAPPDSQTGVEVFGRIFIANADFYQRRAGTLAVAGDGGQHWGVRRGLTTTDPAGAQRRVYQWAHFVPAGHAPDGRRLYRAHGADALEELRFVEGSSSGGNRYFDVYTPPAAPAAAPAPAAALTPGSLTLGSGPGAVTVSIVSHEGRLYVATADGRLRYPIAAGAAFARETVYDRILAPERNVHAIALDIEDGQADGDQAPGAYYRHFLVVTRGADGRPALRFANTVYDWRTSREDGNVTSHLRFDAFPAGGSGSGPYVDGTAPGGAGGASVDLSGAWGSLRGLATGTFDRLRGGLSNAGGAALERARSLGGAILPLAGQAADRIASMMPSAPPSASAVPPSTPPGPPPITLEDLRGIRGLARDAAGQAAANLQRRTEDLTRRARAAGGGLLPLAEQAVERLAGMIPPPPPPSASATPPPPPAGPPPVTLEQLRGVWN